MEAPNTTTDHAELFGRELSGRANFEAGAGLYAGGWCWGVKSEEWVVGAEGGGGLFHSLLSVHSRGIVVLQLLHFVIFLFFK